MGVAGEQPVNRGDTFWDWEFECIGDSPAGEQLAEWEDSTGDRRV